MSNWIFRLIVTVISLSQPCVIAECGEHKAGDDWGIAPNDGSGDTYPDFPEDSDMDFKDVIIFLHLHLHKHYIYHLLYKIQNHFNLETHFEFMHRKKGKPKLSKNTYILAGVLEYKYNK